MLKSRNTKRFASVMMALAITFIANSAISFAARSGNTVPAPEDTPRPSSQFKSGNTVPAPEDTPRPSSQFKSGNTVPAPTDTPKP